MADKTKQWQAKAVTAVFGILAWFLGMAAALVGASPAGAREPMRFQDAYHDGYALVLWENTSVDELETKLARIRQTGATHLIIPYFGCQSDIHSSDVGSCQVLFRTAANVLARDAIELGFTEVSYLPIVATPDWQWRGYFDPKDVDGWFKSYTAWIKGVARDAKKLGMKELVVGSEMTKLYRYEDQWKKVLAEVRTVFDGPLVLTVNWATRTTVFGRTRMRSEFPPIIRSVITSTRHKTSSTLPGRRDARNFTRFRINGSGRFTLPKPVTRA